MRQKRNTTRRRREAEDACVTDNAPSAAFDATANNVVELPTRSDNDDAVEVRCTARGVEADLRVGIGALLFLLARVFVVWIAHKQDVLRVTKPRLLDAHTHATAALFGFPLARGVE